jgi:glycosyltransferase involved in cell wall biosynthesis
MSVSPRLEQAGVALLATRLSVLGHDPCGGSEVLFWEDRDILSQAGIPVRVYGRAARNGAPVNRIPAHLKLPFLSSLEYCGRFLLREPQALLVSYNEPMVAGLAPERTIVRFDWSTPLPRYWRLPGWLSRFQRALYLFPSESERRLFLRLHPLIPPDATVVMANAVDLDLFRPAKQKEPRLRVGFAGQWVERKGVDALLSAWALVKKSLPEAELWLAGGPGLWKGIASPPDPQKTLAQVDESARRGALRVAGELRRAEMPGFWNSLSVAVVPSLYEPFGLVALEALACGVPVVASAVGGLSEIVLDGECGLLVPPNDPQQLAEALLALLRNPDLRSRLAAGTRRRAEAFSLERRSSSLLELLAKRSREAISYVPSAAQPGGDGRGA